MHKTNTPADTTFASNNADDPPNGDPMNESISTSKPVDGETPPNADATVGTGQDQQN